MLLLRVMDTEAELLLFDACKVARGELDLGEVALDAFLLGDDVCGADRIGEGHAAHDERGAGAGQAGLESRP